MAKDQALSNQTKLERVQGKDLVLEFDNSRCIHSRFCVTGAPRSFVANVEGDWLFPDETDTEHLMHIAKQCPSGAIKVDRKDGGKAEEPPEVNTLRVYENGPYAIHANLEIDGKKDGFRRVLCRCGMSASKPYCDGSHNGEDDPDGPVDAFIASGEPKSRDMRMLDDRDGVVEIVCQLNGPLQVTGNLEILAGTGRGVERTKSCRLCRCGQSGNKPFCDGSHAATGFKSDE